jgi:hypothetical protein
LLKFVIDFFIRKAGRQEYYMYLEYENLTSKIIGCAIKVHRILGPGFLESIYENALVIELKKCGPQNKTTI